jgi:DNA polymerase (family 10)
MGIKLPLSKARSFAEKVLETLSPYCERMEIAGSIRRKIHTVSDLDLVVIPRDVKGLMKRCLERGVQMCAGEHVFRIETFAGVQIDIYFAHNGKADLFRPLPSNCGSVLLCRTGSREHNIKICNQANQLGLKWDPSYGIFNEFGDCVAATTEQELFDALKLPYVDPEARG